MEFNVRAVFEETPVRAIAVECPKCKKWFNGRDITEDEIDYEYQIKFASFSCPVCGFSFGYDTKNNNPSVKEVGTDQVYRGCLHQKTIWD